MTHEMAKVPSVAWPRAVLSVIRCFEGLRVVRTIPVGLRAWGQWLAKSSTVNPETKQYLKLTRSPSK